MFIVWSVKDHRVARQMRSDSFLLR